MQNNLSDKKRAKKNSSEKVTKLNSRDANFFCKLRCVLLQTDPSYM